jgi:CheY-like chemotaxis protein
MNKEESGGGQTILIVDDHDFVRLMLAKALRRRGFKIAEANTAKMALDVLAMTDKKVDLALIDVVMPEMSGFTLAEHIDSLYADCKFLFMSGYPFETLEREYGMSADLLPSFLRKPFGAGALVAKINELLGSQVTRRPL